MKHKRCIVIGYGNPGRQDDALGIEFALRVEKDKHLSMLCDVHYDYQLNIEDSLTISEYEIVVFVDASLDGEQPFAFERISPSLKISFTTHSLSAESLLALCEELYRKSPIAYMLAIRGYEWNLGSEMTSEAAENLLKAFRYFNRFVSNGFCESEVTCSRGVLFH
ncbi:MAG: hydrogenase maturation protease [Spirochaetes bacterium]|nr:hydrogenase maturation protease [Spirochaetota bacterium]